LTTIVIQSSWLQQYEVAIFLRNY